MPSARRRWFHGGRTLSLLECRAHRSAGRYIWLMLCISVACQRARQPSRQHALRPALKEIAPDPCGMPTRNAAPLYDVSVGQLVRATIVFVARLFMRQLVVGITIITIPTPNVFKMDWQGSCRLYFAEARAN